MKRTDLLRHLQEHGCELLREGSRHSIFCSSDRTRMSAIPRHREIKNPLVKHICRDLGVPSPFGK